MSHSMVESAYVALEAGKKVYLAYPGESGTCDRRVLELVHRGGRLRAQIKNPRMASPVWVPVGNEDTLTVDDE